MQLNFNNICRFFCSFIAGKQPWRDTVRQIDRQADRFAFVYSKLFDNFALIQSSKLEIAKAQNVKYKAKDHKSSSTATTTRRTNEIHGKFLWTRHNLAWVPEHATALLLLLLLGAKNINVQFARSASVQLLRQMINLIYACGSASKTLRLLWATETATATLCILCKGVCVPRPARVSLPGGKRVNKGIKNTFAVRRSWQIV